MDEHAGAAREWRECAKSLLAGRYRLLDPMRRKFVDREVDSANEIVEFDLLDVRNADIILVNYSRPSIGTSMEVFYASHVLGKFVVAFSPYEYRECSPWMSATAPRFSVRWKRRPNILQLTFRRKWSRNVLCVELSDIPAPAPFPPILLDGLKRLEYRGYDSSGMALAGAGMMAELKEVGQGGAA